MQRVDHRHVLQIETNIMALVALFGRANSWTRSVAMTDDEYDTCFYILRYVLPPCSNVYVRMGTCWQGSRHPSAGQGDPKWVPSSLCGQ